MLVTNDDTSRVRVASAPNLVIIGSFSANKQLIYIRALFFVQNKQQMLRMGSDTGGGGKGRHAQPSLMTSVSQCEERRNATRKQQQQQHVAKVQTPSRSQGPHQKRESGENGESGRKTGSRGDQEKLGVGRSFATLRVSSPLFTVAALPCLHRHPS